MARGQSTKLYRTFNKGLITEAGFLTYPENASTDELNTVLSVKGSRSRRKGLTEEPNGGAVEVFGNQSFTTTEFTWRAVADKGDISFLCVQVGTILHFFNLVKEPISKNKKPFTVELANYLSASGTYENLASTNVEFASGKGLLFAVNENIEPIIVEYFPDTDTISVTRVVIQIRDFDGLNDGLANDEEPSSLSKEHYYNLRNQGWVTPGS